MGGFFVLGSAASVGIALAVIVALVALQPKRVAAPSSPSLVTGGLPGSGDLSQDLSALDRLGRPALDTLQKLGRRITPVGTPARLRKRLDLAGNPRGWGLETLFACKAAGLLLGVGAGIFFLALNPSPVTALMAVGLAAGGYWMTDILLYNTALHRQEKLKLAAADAVDMLTICVEAGQGFDAALVQVAQNTNGPLADELARLVREMQLGRSRAEAFNDFTERTNVPELSNFINALVQADRLGIPIAQVLREQSSEMRLRRRQHAEEQAQKVPVKIIFPVVVCIFPALMIVIVGPGAIQIARMFANM